MTVPLDEQERLALCDLLIEVGPEASTLCEGWTTLDLAAHLVVREQHPLRASRLRTREKGRGMSVLVEQLRSGPPAIWRVPGLRTVLNGLEFFIHHEDVRRANGLVPRRGNPELEDLSWRMLGFLARRAARALRPFSLTLESVDGRRRAFGRGIGVTVSGPPSELVLYFSGRQTAAVVQMHGDPLAVSGLGETVRGL